MELIPLIRFIIFGLALFFSLVELGLCATDIHVTNKGVFLDNGAEIVQLSPFFFPFAAFGLGISVLTLLFVAPIAIIDMIRRGSFTSVIAFELIWTGLLSVLWLAVAGDATAAGIFSKCEFEDGRVNTICHQFPAIQGMAFFNWILFFGWWITLCVLAVRLRKNNKRNGGNANLWRQSVVDARFSMAADSSTRGTSTWNRKGATEMQQFPNTTEGYVLGGSNTQRDPFANPGESV